MTEFVCLSCQERDALIADLRQQLQALQRRVSDLEARLGQSSSSSSVPPSATPPPVAKRPTGRKRGGQPGHEGHPRQRLPAPRVDHTVPHVPDRCAGCSCAGRGSTTPPRPGLARRS